MFSRASVQRRANIPPPIIVQPSGLFDGNDGSWSSYVVRVGNPSNQLSRVLVSTLIPETWVVLDGACNAGLNTNSNCTKTRGGNPNLFKPDQSTSWNAQGSYSFAIEGQLGAPANTDGAAYGYDTLGISTIGNGGGVTLDHQVVGGITANFFWIGMLGINRRRSQFETNNTQDSLLTSLYSSNMIPSLSYSYTAGAFYRGKTNGSLTLGGFDAATFNNPGVNFRIASDNYRDLVVGLQGITYSDNTGTKTTVMDSGILSLIDSTLPNIWLPQSACNAMASAFGLTLNQISQRYTINDTQRLTNYRNGASVNFTIGENISGGSTVTINMPYAAFDLNYTDPGTTNPNATSYFPLKIASDASQYTLGRAFLQEAVITVDYGRGNFTVAQALPVTSATKNVIAIQNGTTGTAGSGNSGSTGSGNGSGTSSVGASDGSSGSNGGAIGGAVGGVLGGLLVIGALVWWFFGRKWLAARKEKKAGKGADSESGASGNAHISQAATPLKGAEMVDVSSPAPPYQEHTHDYFGQAAKEHNIQPAGTPGSHVMGPATAGSSQAPQAMPFSPQSINPYTGIAELPTPESAPSGTIRDLNFQHYNQNNGYLAPNAVPASIAAQAGAGAAIVPVAELRGSGPGEMRHEMHSPSMSELASPDSAVSRSELESPPPQGSAWSPPSHSPSPAGPNPTVPPVNTSVEQPRGGVAEMGATPIEHPGAAATAAGGAAAAVAATDLGAHHRAQRSSATLPQSMQPAIYPQTLTPGDPSPSVPSAHTSLSSALTDRQPVPPLPTNAHTNITAAELAERPYSTATTFFTEALTPSPGDGETRPGYFSPSVAGTEFSEGLSRGPSIMSAQSVHIGTARPNIVQHVRRGSSNNPNDINTIGEENEETTPIDSAVTMEDSPPRLFSSRNNQQHGAP